MADMDPGVVRRLADMHAVYRLFDEAGRLLYIGMSGRAGRRFDDHAVKRWWPLVRTITLEWHATHAAARLAEKRAIADERPRYNVAGSPITPRRPARAKETEPSARPDILSDVLKVFGDAKGLHWNAIAERLNERFPSRYRDVTKDQISVGCRDLGVASVLVSVDGKVLRGCRRADVEIAAANRILDEARGNRP